MQTVPHWLAVALPPPLRRLITAPDVKCLALRRRDGHLAVSAAEGCILLTSLDALRGAAEAHPESCGCAPHLLLAPLGALGCAVAANILQEAGHAAVCTPAALSTTRACSCAVWYAVRRLST